LKTTKELANAAQSYKDGNKEAFAIIYEQSYRYLYACVMHVVKDEEAVQDMLQETYFEIVKSIGTLKDTESFLNWAAAIANRKCFAYLKKNKNLLPADDVEGMSEEIPDDMALIPEEVMQDKEKQRLIREIIDGLSDMQRLCIIGYYYNEQSQESLAEEYGVPVGTVKSHLSRARVKIKLAVEELDVKKETRLYNVAPFMLVLLEEEARDCIIKPMSAALTSIAGAETAEKLSFLGKIKTAWAKLSAGAKAKAAAGAAAICMLGVVAAVAFLRPTMETIPISEEAKELLDQILQVCEEGDYGKLCQLDFTMMDTEEDSDPGTNIIYCHDANGESILNRLHYDADGNGFSSWYYDGKSCRLKETYTGYGIVTYGQCFAVGQFEDGQAVGKIISFYVVVEDGEISENNLDLIGLDDTKVYLSEVNVENGAIVGEASSMSYSLDATGQPHLNYKITGNAVPVCYQHGNTSTIIFYFDGKTEYFEDTFEDIIGPETYTFYLKAGSIDPEHYQSLDGQWLDENGKPIWLWGDMVPGERDRFFSLNVDSEMFRLDSMEIIEIQEELETK